MDGIKAAKKRKLTDKSIPNALSQLPEFAQESKMYQDLLEMERKLDWTMSRKRVEVQDALARTPTTTRTLRVFLSHTVSGQAWQVGETDGEGEAVNFETGQGIPAWSLKVEGRLLEVPNQRSRDKVAPRKFSTFIKRMIVDLDRDPTLYPDGNIVEWPRPQGVQPPLDGFTIRRTGDQPTRVRIVIHLEQSPEQYKLSPELANILGIKEESRIGVIQALWNYIKINGLQDKVDRRKISRMIIYVQLQAASEAYYHVLSKKKESPASGEAEELMSLDALGIVMVTHGEEFGGDSAFGKCCCL
ncbi:hypothetical protein BU15DRAFT_76343 [Melanogaster broomeanus]|nr:hypothetical protein BU15DRAFT_76343 [Melanogaster broomeanus]